MDLLQQAIFNRIVQHQNCQLNKKKSVETMKMF